MKIIECPRDAMQGLHDWIPTDVKVNYINQLLKVGYDTIDFGSFVSPKAIPQLKDTADVLGQLDLSKTNSRLLAIVANTRGALDACNFEEIDYLGFPFSISEAFQLRNTNSTILESLKTVEEMKNISDKANKKLVIYISMGFGNPYGEEWSPEIAAKWSHKLTNELGIEIISLSDTIGVSNPENISYLFQTLIKELPQVEFGAHLHSTPETRNEKIKAAYESGCRRIDAAIAGFGGCPMAADDLVGNMATENVVTYLSDLGELSGIDMQEFEKSRVLAAQVFPL